MNLNDSTKDFFSVKFQTLIGAKNMTNWVILLTKILIEGGFKLRVTRVWNLQIFKSLEK